MSNLILWAHQCTVDYTYQVGHDISTIVGEIIDKQLFPELSQNRTFVAIREEGLSEDTTIVIDQYDTDGTAPKKLAKIRQLLDEKGYPHSIQIGGNPAIAAIRGHLLGRGRELSNLPLAYYVGLYPRSVADFIERQYKGEEREAIQEVFHVKYDIDARPETIGIETPRAKLMLIYGPGRSLGDMAPDGNFSRLFNLLGAVLAGASEKARAVLAINTPSVRPLRVGREEITEIKLAERFVQQIRKTPFGGRVRIYIATRAIGKLNYARAALSLLEHADIVSMNESEANWLHTAYNKGEFSDEPLAYKVRELPLKAIKVCHSADGVIMDLGCVPETIITSKDFVEQPADFLEEVLRLSADGATYAMDATAGLGRTANEAMIRIYSRNVHPESRQNSLFKRTFLNVTNPMPAGMVSISSAQVVRTRGAVVGLGAIFDGLLLSFLMRD